MRMSFTGNPLREIVLEQLRAEEKTFVFDVENMVKTVVEPLKNEANFPQKALDFFAQLEGIAAFDSSILREIQAKPSGAFGETLLEKVLHPSFFAKSNTDSNLPFPRRRLSLLPTSTTSKRWTRF